MAGCQKVSFVSSSGTNWEDLFKEGGMILSLHRPGRRASAALRLVSVLDIPRTQAPIIVVLRPANETEDTLIPGFVWPAFPSQGSDGPIRIKGCLLVPDNYTDKLNL